MNSPSALAPKPADATLSLVNMAARQRMLSQRMTLQTVLAAQGDTVKLDEARKSLQLFVESHAKLLGTRQTLEPENARKVEATYLGPKGVGPVIDEFVNLLRTTLDQIAARNDTHHDALSALVGMVDRILTALNTATTTFDEITKAKADAIMRELTGIVGDIQSVAKEAKVVSFNAQVMAARAGQHGREFAVVANVLSGITAEIDGLTRKAMTLADRSKQTA